MLATAQLALDTILQKPTTGIPSWMLHIMEHEHIERIAGTKPGEYKRNPVETYLAMQRALGTCLLDQFIPENPLSPSPQGYESAQHGPTTGATEIILDGILINSPEAVVQHLEEHEFPRLREAISTFDENVRAQEIISQEQNIQSLIGPSMLKSGYGFVGFPCLRYGVYGYINYFSAYALYPDIMEKDFALQANLALRNNRAAAKAYVDGNLPPLYRLDHDMADSRGTLVRIETLDRMWFPHFARCIEPLVQAGVRMIWHCDGNLMEMVPRLMEAGVAGFQGFQYEHGMDYERICKMRTRWGDNLIIIAGVSVTQTLPFGTPADVKREISWLVENGPKTGLFLGGSSSIAPGVPWENIRTLLEGLEYYRTYGRHSVI